MEHYKQKEIEHYDSAARAWRTSHNQIGNDTNATDISGESVMVLPSYVNVYKKLKKLVVGKCVLDYGCGRGMHALPIAEMGAREVVGIDLSEESLRVARELATQLHAPKNVKFIKMDAEKLEFPDASFDLVFDGGTFSSIDITKGFPEIARVLRPGGLLVGIETLGHNPFTNIKRYINKKRGIRTAWATDHIMKMKHIVLAKHWFDIVSTQYFHFLSMFVFPFRRTAMGIFLFRFLDTIDRVLLLIPFLNRLSFKIVFVLKKR